MQSCSNCEQEYDAVRHIPRILISCGHTYCQQCIQQVINEEKEAAQQSNSGGNGGRVIKTQQSSLIGSRKSAAAVKDKRENATTPQTIVFECFECGIPCQIDPKLGVNGLPKNMVLIPPTPSVTIIQAETATELSTTGATKPTQVSAKQQLRSNTLTGQSQENILGSNAANNTGSGVSVPRQGSSSCYEESSSLVLNEEGCDTLDQSYNRDEASGAALCKLHPAKKIEAFCEKDFKLLCIDCILSDRHKNHEIVSIAKATEKHQAFLHTQQEVSMNTSQKLISSKNEIQRHMQLMKLQADNNRRELSILYNGIRDMLIQREQALKTYISEVYQKEEASCETKISTIEDALANIEDYEENIAMALEESEIDLLRKFNERKLLVNTFNADQQIKELTQLNVGQYGLANGPPVVVQSSQKSKKQVQQETTQLEEQPPFQSLCEIKKDTEQLQVSKIINPSFKGQLTSCAGILPFIKGPEEKSVSQSHSSLYQQHTAASSLKVNKRATNTLGGGTSQQDKTGSQSIAAADQHETAPQSNQARPFNQYRRPVQNSNQNLHLSSNASPKPGENKRRQAQNLLNNQNSQSAYGNSAKVSSNISRQQQNTLQQQRTHSYGLNSHNITTIGKESGGGVADRSTITQSNNQINLFNQIKPNNIGTKGRGTVHVSSRLYPNNKQPPLLQSVTTQRVSLQDDTSLDLKHIPQTGSDRQLLKVNKQQSSSGLDSDAMVSNQIGGSGKNFKRGHQRGVNQDNKQISDDLFNVQMQVNQVMSNLETFESKKRQHSAKKDQRITNKMFQRGSPQMQVVKEQKEFRSKVDLNVKQAPVSNLQLHKRNTSSAYNDAGNSLNVSQTQKNLPSTAHRMTSPPGKQHLLQSQQPRKPAADNVIGNISIDKTQSQEDETQNLRALNSSIDEDQLPNVHIKLEEQQQQDNNQQQKQMIKDRKLSNPNQQIQLADIDSDYGANASMNQLEESKQVDSNANNVATKVKSNGNDKLRQKNQANNHNGNKQQRNSNDSRGSNQHTARERIKSPIVRIDLSGNENDRNGERNNNDDDVNDTQDEHIANLPELVNDSMVGDLNQLISDLNKGQKPMRQLSASRQQHEDVAIEHDSFEKQAKALYFDLGSPSDNPNKNCENIVQQAKTVDYVAADGEYMTSNAGGRKLITGGTRSNNGSAEKALVDTKKQQNKQKFIEQSVKAQQLHQSITAAGNPSMIQQMRQSRDKSRDASQPRSSKVPKVPDLQLDKLTNSGASQNNGGSQAAQQQPVQFNFLKSDRSSQEPTTVPTREANKLTPNESGPNQPDQSLQAHNAATNHVLTSLSTEQDQAKQNQPLLQVPNQLVLSASESSAYSQGMHSMSQASIDPFKALCQPRDEYIFVFSGFNERKLTQCEVFDAQRSIWKEIAQIQNPRTKFAAVPISKTRILIFGGKQADGQRTADIEEYNLKNNSFKTLPFKMPKARSGFAACIRKDEARIYFCGGNSGSGSNGSVLRKFDCLDLKKGKWSRLNDMLMKRDELSVAFGPDGNIYAIGGFGGSLLQSANNNDYQKPQISEGAEAIQPESTDTTGVLPAADTTAIQQSEQFCQCLKEAERFNFVSQTWEMLPPMKEARRALAAVVLPDGIYAIGGYDGRQYLATVEKYDLNKQEWVYVKSMNTARCTLSAVASSDCQYIYVLGGYNGKALNLVERYSVMSNSWELMPPMNVKRFMHQSVALMR